MLERRKIEHRYKRERGQIDRYDTHFIVSLISCTSFPPFLGLPRLSKRASSSSRSSAAALLFISSNSSKYSSLSLLGLFSIEAELKWSEKFSLLLSLAASSSSSSSSLSSTSPKSEARFKELRFGEAEEREEALPAGLERKEPDAWRGLEEVKGRRLGLIATLPGEPAVDGLFEVYRPGEIEEEGRKVEVALTNVEPDAFPPKAKKIS